MPTDRRSPVKTSHDRSRVLSVRLTNDEFDHLSAQADELGVGASTLARTLVRQGLSLTSSSTKRPATQGSSPLEAQIVADLLSRVETLERWVAEH